MHQTAQTRSARWPKSVQLAIAMAVASALTRACSSSSGRGGLPDSGRGRPRDGPPGPGFRRRRRAPSVSWNGDATLRSGAHVTVCAPTSYSTKPPWRRGPTIRPGRCFGPMTSRCPGLPGTRDGTRGGGHCLQLSRRLRGRRAGRQGSDGGRTGETQLPARPGDPHTRPHAGCPFRGGGLEPCVCGPRASTARRLAISSPSAGTRAPRTSRGTAARPTARPTAGVRPDQKRQG